MCHGVAIYETAIRALRDGLGADRSAVLLFDADGVMRFTAHRGLSLVVDDEQDSRDMLAMLLEQRGARVMETARTLRSRSWRMSGWIW